MTLIAQAIGIVAMFFNIFSYQKKSAKGVIGFQLCGASLFAVNFFMLGAYSGGMLNVVAVIRAILFLNGEKLKMDKLIWQVPFLMVYVLSYILTFAVFGKEITAVNMVVECLPVIGLALTTIAFRYSNAAIIRRYSFVCSIAWLIYNIAVGSIGAICCEAFSIISIIVGFFRLDKKKKEN